MGFNLDSLLDILYPPLCLHCSAYLEKGKKLFCSLCIQQLTPIDPQERCSTCFAPKSFKKKCDRCCTRAGFIKRQAASFPCFGPASTLSTSLKKGHVERVGAVSSLLALQWTQLDFPLHDAVTALPISTFTRLKRGCDVNALLAQEMARYTMRPFIAYLRAKFDSSAFLTKGHFTTSYVLKEKEKKSIFDQRILIVSLELDDPCFRAAGSLLQGGYAKEIYALAFIDAAYDVQNSDDRDPLIDTH